MDLVPGTEAIGRDSSADNGWFPIVGANCGEYGDSDVPSHEVALKHQLYDRDSPESRWGLG